MRQTVVRALKMLVRNPLRSALLVGVLSVSIGLALIMITVNGAFATRLDDIQSQVGTTITVRPAGSFGGGFFGGRGGGNDGGNGAPNANGGNQANGNTAAATTPTPLTQDDVSKVTGVPDVQSVSSTMTTPYTGAGLVSSVQRPGGGAGGAGSFTPPVLITGTNDPSSLSSIGVQDAQLTSGRTFNDNEGNADVAVVGQALATKNNLSVGSTFPINGTSFEVVGIYTTGTQFGDNSLFIPLLAAQTVFSRPGEIDQMVVQADTVSNVDKVANDIKSTLGADNVDVTTEASQFDRISAPLSDAKDSSQIGMIVALVASAVVILFSVGLVARQRIKEIGILKAVGASSWHVIGQFGFEMMFISIAAAFIGALATFPLAQSVANSLISTPATGAGGRVFGAGGGGPGAVAVQTRVGGLLGSVDVAVSPEVFLYALVIAIVLAVVATVVPAWYVGRVRPAEVLRHE